MGRNEKFFVMLMGILFLGFSGYMLEYRAVEPEFVFVVDTQVPQIAAEESETVTITVDREKTPEPESSTEVSHAPVTLININTATLGELMTLKNIGEQRGQDIIDYRTTHGKFASIEDITLVSGIGDGIFSNIKEFITVG